MPSRGNRLVGRQGGYSPGSRAQALEALEFKVQLAPNQVYAAGKLQLSEDITQYIDWKGYFT